MNHEPLSPEAFARLVSLPPEHPERIRAAESPEFVARLRLLEAFETPDHAVAGAADAAAAGRELTARLTRTLPATLPATPLAVRPRMWRTPQFAFAAAAAFIVAASSLWWVSRPAPGPAVRGEATPSAFHMLAPVTLAGALELRWTPAPGADAYRVLVHGPDLGEVVRLEVGDEPRAVLRRDALPASIGAGIELLVEVEAMRRGDPIARTAAQRVLAP